MKQNAFYFNTENNIDLRLALSSFQSSKNVSKTSLSMGHPDDYRFFNDGTNSRLFFSYRRDGYTQFMFKHIAFKSSEDISYIEAIEINFFRLKKRKTIIYLVNLMCKFELEPNTLFFNSDLDYEVLEIPDDAEVLGIQVIGKNLEKSTFEIILPHFLV